MANIASSTVATHKRPRFAHILGRIALYVTVTAVSVLTIFPIYWMLVSTFQPSKYTLHYPPPLFPQAACARPFRRLP